MLPLPVGDDGAQQQGDDSHEVEVPLGAQELVQVHLSHQLLHLAGVTKEGGRGQSQVWFIFSRETPLWLLVANNSYINKIAIINLY